MKIITTTYTGPDLDGYGCAMAYAELLRAQGKEAEAHVWGEPHVEVQWLIKTFGLPTASDPIDDTEAQVVLLDCSSTDDLPGSFSIEQVVEVIDHRHVHTGDAFVNAELDIEHVGAAATLVAERFQKEGIEPTPESALYLLGGIISNTQNFSTVTTDRDREMAAWLASVANAPEDLAQQMFEAKSDLSGSRLQETLLNDLKVLTIHDRRFAVTQLEIVGVVDLVEGRREEILSILKSIQSDQEAEFCFVNMKELETGQSYLLCADDITRAFLLDMPDVEWNDHLGHSKTLTLRKHIAAWIEEKLSK